MQGNTHNYKGNPMAIKPTLDREQLTELRKAHWKTGGQSAVVVDTQNTRNFRPLTAKVRCNARPVLD